jgi:hypothetical protein
MEGIPRAIGVSLRSEIREEPNCLNTPEFPKSHMIGRGEASFCREG